MAANKKAQQLARQLFKLSIVDGAISAERVSGVLGYIEKTQPAHQLTVLKSYHRFVAAELANIEVVQHGKTAVPHPFRIVVQLTA